MGIARPKKSLGIRGVAPSVVDVYGTAGRVAVKINKKRRGGKSLGMKCARVSLATDLTARVI